MDTSASSEQTPLSVRSLGEEVNSLWATSGQNKAQGTEYGHLLKGFGGACPKDKNLSLITHTKVWELFPRRRAQPRACLHYAPKQTLVALLEGRPFLQGASSREHRLRMGNLRCGVKSTFLTWQRPCVHGLSPGLF